MGEVPLYCRSFSQPQHRGQHLFLNVCKTLDSKGCASPSSADDRGHVTNFQYQLKKRNRFRFKHVPFSLLSAGVPPEAGLSVPRRACLSRSGPVCPEAGLSVPRRACLSQGGPVYLKAGMSVLRRACPSLSGPACSEAGLFAPGRAYPSVFIRVYVCVNSRPRCRLSPCHSHPNPALV